MFKKLFIFGLMITSLFGVRELTDENFKKATNRGLVAVEFWATWNEMNKVTAIDEWDSFDAKVYRSEERRVGKECRSRWSTDH